MVDEREDLRLEMRLRLVADALVRRHAGFRLSSTPATPILNRALDEAGLPRLCRLKRRLVQLLESRHQVVTYSSNSKRVIRHRDWVGRANKTVMFDLAFDRLMEELT